MSRGKDKPKPRAIIRLQARLNRRTSAMDLPKGTLHATGFGHDDGFLLNVYYCGGVQWLTTSGKDAAEAAEAAWVEARDRIRVAVPGTDQAKAARKDREVRR